MQGIIVMVVLIWVLPAIIKKLKKVSEKAASSQTGQPAAQRRAPTVEMHRPVPSMTRPTATAVRSAQRDFRAPEAPCIVCEQTGEDHFLRDKARRIAQLDDWLKNGLIDRSEYAVMKDRYQRDI